MPKITLMAYENLVGRQQLYARDFVEDLTDNHEGYSHTVSAIGGYDQATFIIKGTNDYLKDWFADGILRRIASYNPEGNMIWEGFVNRLKFNKGVAQITKSVENYFNRVYLRYVPTDYSFDPPVPTTPITLLVDNIEQRLKYGTKALTITGGGEKTDESAFEWATNILKYRSSKFPEGQVQATGQSENAYMEVECRGYWHTLAWVPFINIRLAPIGTKAQEPVLVQAHEVIQEVILSFNNINPGWISDDFSKIAYNYRVENRIDPSLGTCLDKIVDIIKIGGKGGERWVGGIYQNRQFIFKPAEDFEGLYGTEDRIENALEDPTQKYYDAPTDTEVKPWDMLPDRVLKTRDIR